MTGPDHYSAAEELLSHMENASGLSDTEKQRLLDGAQVHATLALAAVTAQVNRQNFDGPPGMDLHDQVKWDAVTRAREAW